MSVLTTAWHCKTVNCALAHLKRDFTCIAERSGIAGELGKALLEEQRLLFEQWYRVRDGTLSRTQFGACVEPIRLPDPPVALRLEPVITLRQTRKRLRAKTVRTCQQLLKVEPPTRLEVASRRHAGASPALWTFVTADGVEPTNNAAERALRPAVLWRKNSFGSQSEAGSLFVSRMLTVVTTLRAQNRPVLDYLVDACRTAMAWSSCSIPIAC